MALFRFKVSQHQTQFNNWPDPDPVADESFDKFNHVKVLPGIAEVGDHPFQKYSRTIVIALGDTGGLIVQQWLDQVTHEEIGKQKFLYALLINKYGDKKLTSSQVLTDEISLVQDDLKGIGFSVSPISVSTNKRAEMQAYFRKNSNLSDFSQWLQGCLFKLGFENGARVFIVGSIYEPIIGIIGDVLHILRALPGTKNPFSSICALLSTENTNTKESISEDECYAALTEVTRMCYGGIHQLDPLPDFPEKFYQNALLDQLFLFDFNARVTKNWDTYSIGEEKLMGEAVSEVLFNLAHPSADIIWENLHDTQRSDRLLLNTAGIRTLLMPIAEIRSYISDRLMMAAFFGEDHVHSDEGFFRSSRSGFIDSHHITSIIENWFFNGSNSHPLFQWIFSITSSKLPRNLPVISDKFNKYLLRFTFFVRDGLVELLNDQDMGNKFGVSLAVLSELHNRFVECQNILKSNLGLIKNQDAFPDLQRLIKAFRDSISDFIIQINEWVDAVGNPGDEYQPGSHRQPNEQLTRVRTASNDNLLSDPYSGINLINTKSTIKGEKTPTKHGFYQKLHTRSKVSKRKLIATTKGRFRKGLANNNLKDIENYYIKSIRPELEQINLPAGSAFLRVRERLHWKIQFDFGKDPRVLIVFIPPDCAGSDKLPEAAYYSPQDLSQLIDAVHEVAIFQTVGCSEDLRREWFQSQLDKNLAFLEEASDPLLGFINQQSDSQAYLINHEPEINSKIKSDVFHSAKSVPGGAVNRCAALTIWQNILLSSIIFPDSLSFSKRRSEKMQLYKQEKISARYEWLIQKRKKRKNLEIPPSIILTLVNPKIVSLFSQALFGNLINVSISKQGNTFWTLESIGRFSSLALSPGTASNPKSLFEAYKRFTLELPNQKLDELNPDLHFGKSNVNEFLSELHMQVYQLRQQENFPQCDLQLLERIEQWTHHKDLTIQAFSELLLVELDSPKWEKWELTQEEK